MLNDLYSAENVEAYLSNKLSYEDVRRFEKKLEEDENFSEFVSIFKDVDKAIVEDGVMELRNSLKSLHEVATEEWLDEAPMIVETTHDQDVDAAIAEEDVMQLRSMLNDIHDLNKEELHEASVGLEEFSIDELDGLLGEDLDDEEVAAAILDDDVNNLRDKLKEIGEKSETSKERIPVYKRLSKLTAVASIFLFLLIGGAFYIYFDSKPMKPEKVVAKYYEPVVLRGPQRGGFEDVDKLDVKLRNAFDYYRTENYQHALDLFEVIEEHPSFSNDMELAATAGMCLFFLDRQDEAKSYFDKIINDFDNSYVDLAEWFLAGCLLTNRELEDDGVDRYRKIARKPEHEYKEDSRKVLKKLKN